MNIPLQSPLSCSLEKEHWLGGETVEKNLENLDVAGL